MKQMPYILLACVVLSACWDMGTDPKGPYKAIFVIRDKTDEDREFYLGGFHSFEDCAGLIEFEAGELKGDAFWTTPAYDYGGEPSRFEDGWIEHRVLEIKCRFEP